MNERQAFKIARQVLHIFSFGVWRHDTNILGNPHLAPSLVGVSHSSTACTRNNLFMANLAKQTMVTMSRSKSNKSAGRTAKSHEVELLPQFRNPVDIARLGKAVMAMAERMAELDTDKQDCEGKS